MTCDLGSSIHKFTKIETLKTQGQDQKQYKTKQNATNVKMCLIP